MYFLPAATGSMEVPWTMVKEDIYIYIYIIAENKYRYAPHYEVSVNDGPHIRRWSHKIKIL